MIMIGFVVYSTTIVAVAEKGLEMKLLIEYAVPLKRTGKSTLFIWYAKPEIEATFNRISPSKNMVKYVCV